MVEKSALKSLALKQHCMRSSLERSERRGNKHTGASEMRPVNCNAAVVTKVFKEPVDGTSYAKYHSSRVSWVKQ